MSSSLSLTIKNPRSEKLPQKPTLTLKPLPWIARPPLPADQICTSKDVSNLTSTDLKRIRSQYHIPTEVTLDLPKDGWIASQAPLGWICIYEDQLKSGLRFPIHPFIRSVLIECKISITQLVPNGFRMLIKFLTACGEQGVQPTLELFRYCFQVRKAANCKGYRTFHGRSKFCIIVPENNHGWRNKYLYAYVPGLDLVDKWNLAEIQDSRSDSSVVPPSGYEKLKDLPAQNGRKIFEEELVRHGLSPAKLTLPPKPQTRASKKGRKDSLVTSCSLCA